MKKNAETVSLEIARLTCEIAFDKGYLKALYDIKSALVDNSITINKREIERIIKKAKNTFKKNDF